MKNLLRNIAKPFVFLLKKCVFAYHQLANALDRGGAKIDLRFKKLVSLMRFQKDDRIDNSWKKSKKTIIQKTVFFLLKFILIAGVVALAIWLFHFLGIFNKTQIVNLYTIFLTIYGILVIFSTTHELMKNFYYSDDNKVLITLPVSTRELFCSKIGVEYIYTLINTSGLLLPITLGFIIGGIINGVVTIGVVFWAIVIVYLFATACYALAALLSIPYYYVYKFFKTHPIVELIGLIVLVGGVITILVLLIGLIPKDIDLVNDWPAMRKTMEEFFERTVPYAQPFYFVARAMIGKMGAGYIGFRLTGSCVADGAIILAAALVLAVIALIVIKPFYFSMMTKTFEFDKNAVLEAKPNKKHRKILTFINNDLKLSFRDFEISGSYITIYIIVPLLLYFIDTVFSAISTRLEGQMMTYAFNILLIVLPYLASNSMIATLYSKEGRAAYVKKTNPINAIIPLSSKLVFNLCLSIPSIVMCSVIFGGFAKIGVLAPILLGVSVLLIQYGHIFFSATRDIMNPQNEAYATNGNETNNPNERVATVVGFAIAFIFALVSYFLCVESYNTYKNFNAAFIKLLIISLATFGSFFALYLLKVKAYYLEK